MKPSGGSSPVCDVSPEAWRRARRKAYIQRLWCACVFMCVCVGGGEGGWNHPGELAHAGAGDHVEVCSVLGVEERHLAEALVVRRDDERDDLQLVEPGCQLQHGPAVSD